MLEVKNLTKNIEGKSIINSLNLKIEGGQNIALLGPNGAGKTTSIKLLMGLLYPDFGDVIMNGTSLREDKTQYLKAIGYVPDEPFFYEELKGSEFLRFTADLWDKDLLTKNNKHIVNTIDSLEMNDFLNEPIHTYSLGMKKKLSILIAIVHQPKLLIMDEPLNGLDPMTIYSIKKYINNYIKDGNSVLMSTHMMDVAENFCSHVAIMKQGDLIVFKSIEMIKEISNNTLEEYFVDTVLKD